MSIIETLYDGEDVLRVGRKLGGSTYQELISQLTQGEKLVMVYANKLFVGTPCQGSLIAEDTFTISYRMLSGRQARGTAQDWEGYYAVSSADEAALHSTKVNQSIFLEAFTRTMVAVSDEVRKRKAMQDRVKAVLNKIVRTSLLATVEEVGYGHPCSGLIEFACDSGLGPIAEAICRHDGGEWPLNRAQLKLYWSHGKTDGVDRLRITLFNGHGEIYEPTATRIKEILKEAGFAEAIVRH